MKDPSDLSGKDATLLPVHSTTDSLIFPELTLGNDRVVVGWYELVATPHWTTVLVYPEDDVLRLWLLASPAEIGDQGTDDILQMLANYTEEIV